MVHGYQWEHMAKASVPPSSNKIHVSEMGKEACAQVGNAASRTERCHLPVLTDQVSPSTVPTEFYCGINSSETSRETCGDKTLNFLKNTGTMHHISALFLECGWVIVWEACTVTLTPLTKIQLPSFLLGSKRKIPIFFLFYLLR